MAKIKKHKISMNPDYYKNLVEENYDPDNEDNDKNWLNN